MERGELLREGKSKRVWAAGPDTVIIEYKDDATAFNGVKRESVADKARINCALSWHLMQHVATETRLPTHQIQQLGPTEQLCRRVDIVPVEVVVRNVVAGSCAKRFGRKEGEVLPFPMVEFFYKSDELGDPPISDVHALAFGWAESWELEYLRHAGLKVNACMKAYWADLGITLVDFKIEFGRSSEGMLLLADEITPDGARLWETATGRHLDKDVFRRDLGDLSETYRELYARVFGQALER